MRGVEFLHQSGRAIVIYVPKTGHHRRDARDQERSRQTAQRLVAPLVAKPRTTARENHQPRSLRLEAVNVLGLERGVKGYSIGRFRRCGGPRSELRLVGQRDRGEHRGLLIAQRVGGQMDDLVFAYLFDERAFGGLPPVEDQAMWI